MKIFGLAVEIEGETRTEILLKDGNLDQLSLHGNLFVRGFVSMVHFLSFISPKMKDIKRKAAYLRRKKSQYLHEQ